MEEAIKDGQLAAFEKSFSALGETANVNSIFKDVMTAFRKELKTASENSISFLTTPMAKQYPQIVKYLIQQGANYLAFEAANNRHLIHLAVMANSQELVVFLLENGSSVLTKNTEKRSPLFLAAHDNNIPLAKLLLTSQHGTTSNVNDPDAMNSTPLSAAARKGHVDMISLLLSHGADVEARDAETWSPLHWTCRNGHVEATRALCNFGADTNAVEKMKATPLQLAVIVEQAEIVEILIEHGANLEFKGKNGFTPLHLACVKGLTKITQAFLRRGVDLSILTGNGCTPLHLTSLSGHAEIAQLLIDEGADVDAQESAGQTPLHLAASKNHIEVVSILLSYGADSDIVDNTSLSPLHIAISRAYYDVAAQLIDNNLSCLTVDYQSFNLNHLWKIAIEDQHWAFATALLRSALANEMVVKCDRSVDTKAATKIGVSSSQAHTDMRLNILEYDSTLEQALQNSQIDFAELLIQTRESSDDEIINHKQLGHVRRSSMKKIAKLLGGEFDDEASKATMMSDDNSSPKATSHSISSVSSSSQPGKKAGSFSGPVPPTGTFVRSNSLRGSMTTSEAIQSFSLIRVIDPSNRETFVHYAVRSQNTDLLQKLISEGYSVNTRRSRFAGSLHLGNAAVGNSAGQHSVTDLNDVLLMPLHYACAEGSIDVVEILLKNGAYINAREMKNNKVTSFTPLTDYSSLPKMPLYYACEKGHLPVVQLLLRSGASMREPHFSACLAIAEENNHFDVCSFLEQVATMAQPKSVHSMDVQHTNSNMSDSLTRSVQVLCEKQTTFMAQHSDMLDKISSIVEIFGNEHAVQSSGLQIKQLEAKLALLQKENQQLRSVSLTTEKLIQRANATSPSIVIHRQLPTVKDKAALFGTNQSPQGQVKSLKLPSSPSSTHSTTSSVTSAKMASGVNTTGEMNDDHLRLSSSLDTFDVSVDEPLFIPSPSSQSAQM